MSLEFDRQSYAQLLASVAPQVIEDEVEYDRLLLITEKLMFSDRTPEEAMLFRLLVLLIEAYEIKTHSIPAKSRNDLQRNPRPNSGTHQSTDTAELRDPLAELVWFYVGD